MFELYAFLLFCLHYLKLCYLCCNFPKIGTVDYLFPLIPWLPSHSTFQCFDSCRCYGNFAYHLTSQTILITFDELGHPWVLVFRPTNQLNYIVFHVFVPNIWETTQTQIQCHFYKYRTTVSVLKYAPKCINWFRWSMHVCTLHTDSMSFGIDRSETPKFADPLTCCCDFICVVIGSHMNVVIWTVACSGCRVIGG